MRLDIQSSDFPLTDALREYAERRLKFALAGASAYIRRVEVRFSDINGPRGGIDKCCSIQVTLKGPTAVVIEDTENSLYLAIDRAAGRTGRSVTRRLERRNGRLTGRASDRRATKEEPTDPTTHPAPPDRKYNQYP